MNKDNLQQNLALAARQSGKNKLVQRTFEDNLPQFSKKEINKMLDKCQASLNFQATHIMELTTQNAIYADMKIRAGIQESLREVIKC